MQSIRLTVEDLYQVVLTLQEKEIVQDMEAKNYLDVLAAKFPKDVSQIGLRAHCDIEEVDQAYRRGDRDSIV